MIHKDAPHLNFWATSNVLEADRRLPVPGARPSEIEEKRMFIQKSDSSATVAWTCPMNFSIDALFADVKVCIAQFRDAL
jgi:hypothetical protein